MLSEMRTLPPPPEIPKFAVDYMLNASGELSRQTAEILSGEEPWTAEERAAGRRLPREETDPDAHDTAS